MAEVEGGQMALHIHVYLLTPYQSQAITANGSTSFGIRCKTGPLNHTLKFPNATIGEIENTGNGTHL